MHGHPEIPPSTGLWMENSWGSHPAHPLSPTVLSCAKLGEGCFVEGTRAWRDGDPGHGDSMEPQDPAGGSVSLLQPHTAVRG